MPKSTVADWDTTAGNNTDIGGVSLAEGSAGMRIPATNNAFREMMAQIKTGIGVSFQAYSASLTGVAAAWTTASASGPASLAFAEDTDNGTNKVIVTAPSSLGSDVTLTLPSASVTIRTEADAAAFRAKTADRSLTTTGVWDAAAEVTLTDDTTIAVDLSTGINFVVTLGGNRTLGNPTNEKVGQSGVIRIVQDGSGGRTLAYGSDWEFAGGTAPTLSTAIAAQDLLFYHVIATDRVFGSLIKAIA